ncbi:hypothetical protein KKD80_02610 [Patescibacteria group bacterium]|nr:hypothetical protein [Patescibacteria group bacterium]
METKLTAIVVALFVASCGLETEGFGESGLDTMPEASPDAEPDILEEDDAGPDEVAPDVPETAEDDAGEDEATDEGSEADAEDAETEDSDVEDGTIDPCALPEIPTTGLFIFYCFDYDLLSPMDLEFQVEQGGIPIISWRASLECSVTRSRRLECTLAPLVWNASYIFNIRLDSGIGIGWSCGPELLAIWGTPHVWLDGTELAVTSVTNGDGGCNHGFVTPSPP